MFLAAAVAAMSCTAQVPDNQCQIEIEMQNMPDTIYMLYTTPDRRGYDKCDTLVAVNGKHSCTATIDEARMAALRYDDDAPTIQLYLLPGNRLVLTGDAASGVHEMGGSEAYRQLQEGARLINDAQAKINGLNAEFASRMEAGENADDVRGDIIPKYEAIIADYGTAASEFIQSNPSNLGSVLLLTEMDDADEFEKCSAIVTEEAKGGVMAPLYNRAKERFDKEMARKAARASLAEGAEAPDFTLPAIDGKELSLSSLRGKYVIIDFWGSWCGWCIKGMPEMKKYYEKYSGKLEILGVDCRDTDEQWKAAVEKHALTWKHVKNGEGDKDITTRYAIEGYPTKLIVDPEGRIVRYIVGEDPAFYTALDEVLGK